MTDYLLCAVISVLLSCGLPIALLLLWRMRCRRVWWPALIGAATFVLFALVLEQLCHAWALQQPVLLTHTGLYVLYAGLAAGVFEETGRYLAFRFVLRKADRQGAVAYGIGHGGIEAILLAGINAVSSLVSIIVLQSRGPEALTAMLGAESAQTLQATLAGVDPSLLMVGGLERIPAIFLHISLSVLVWQAVRNHKPLWFVLAIALHALIDCFAVLFSVGIISNIWLIELGVALLTLPILYLAVRVYCQAGRKEAEAAEQLTEKPAEQTETAELPTDNATE